MFRRVPFLSSIIGENIITPDTCNKKPKGDKPWFNYECKVARQHYRKLKRKLKIKRTEALKQDVAEAEYFLLRYTEINFFI
jgi:hypothetical protein